MDADFAYSPNLNKPFLKDRRVRELHAKLNDYLRAKTARVMNMFLSVAGEFNDDVRTACIFLVNMVLESNRLPSGMQFEIRGKDGTVHVLDSTGEVQEDNKPELTYQLEEREDDELSAVRVAFDLCGLDTKFTSFKDLMVLKQRSSISHGCFNDLVNVNPHLEYLWKMRDILAFYLKHGRRGWISPVDALIMVNHDLRRIFRTVKEDSAGPSGVRETIRDSMANAGRLGFCPGKFLREVVRPLLRRHRGRRFDVERFERDIGSMFDMFTYTATALDRAEMGEDARRVTVHYFFKSLARSNLKIHNNNFYDASLCTRTRFLTEIAGLWTSIVSTRLGREVAMSYGRYYIQQLVKVEIPKMVMSGLARLRNHVEFLSRQINRNDACYTVESFNLAKQRRIFEKIYEYWPREADFLKLLIKHLDITEQFGENQSSFWLCYRRYFNLMLYCSVKTYDDMSFIERMFDLRPRHPCEEGEIESFAMQYLRYARTAVSRQEFIEFLEECPVLSRELFKCWRKLRQPGRRKLTEWVGNVLKKYLYNQPDMYATTSGLPGAVSGFLADQNSRSDLETSVVAKLVRSSHLSRAQVKKRLADKKYGTPPPVPAPYVKSKVLEVTYRGRNEDRAFDDVPNRDITALKKQATSLSKAIGAAGLEPSGHFLTQYLYPIFKRLKQLEGLKKEVAEEIETLEGDSDGVSDKKQKKLGKKLTGLETQMVRPARLLAVYNKISQGRLTQQEKHDLYELAAVIYSYDKSGQDQFSSIVTADIFARLSDEMRVRPPYIYLENLTGRERSYDLKSLLAMLALYGEPSRTYFFRVLKRYRELSRADLKESFEALLVELGLKHLVDESLEGLANFFHETYQKYQKAAVINREIESLSEEMKRRSGQSKRRYTLVCARKLLDQFYGHIGENCTSQYPGEIYNPDFIPCRIVDDESKTIKGYIHLLKVRFNDQELLVVPGIEPKVSLLTEVDVKDFYNQVRNALIEYAEADKVDALLYSYCGSATSNRPQISSLMRQDMDIHGCFSIKLKERFPGGSGYQLGQCVAIWTRPGENIEAG